MRSPPLVVHLPSFPQMSQNITESYKEDSKNGRPPTKLRVSLWNKDFLAYHGCLTLELSPTNIVHMSYPKKKKKMQHPFITEGKGTYEVL